MSRCWSGVCVFLQYFQVFGLFFSFFPMCVFDIFFYVPFFPFVSPSDLRNHFPTVFRNRMLFFDTEFRSLVVLHFLLHPSAGAAAPPLLFVFLYLVCFCFAWVWIPFGFGRFSLNVFSTFNKLLILQRCLLHLSYLSRDVRSLPVPQRSVCGCRGNEAVGFRFAFLRP